MPRRNLFYYRYSLMMFILFIFFYNTVSERMLYDMFVINIIILLVLLAMFRQRTINNCPKTILMHD